MYICIFFPPLSTLCKYWVVPTAISGKRSLKYIARGKTLFLGEKPARSLCPLVQLVQAGRWEVELVEAQLSSFYPLAQAGQLGLIVVKGQVMMMMMHLFFGRVLPGRGTGPCPRRRRA